LKLHTFRVTFDDVTYIEFLREPVYSDQTFFSPSPARRERLARETNLRGGQNGYIKLPTLAVSHAISGEN